MLLTANAAWMWGKSLITGDRPYCVRHFGNIEHAIVCNCLEPHKVILKGRNSDGTFATAAAKTYPPLLCSFLAEPITRNPKCKSIALFDPWSSEDPVCIELLQYYFALDPFSDNLYNDAGYVPDFHARQ